MINLNVNVFHPLKKIYLSCIQNEKEQSPKALRAMNGVLSNFWDNVKESIVTLTSLNEGYLKGGFSNMQMGQLFEKCTILATHGHFVNYKIKCWLTPCYKTEVNS